MAGSIRKRGEHSWELRVHLGRDPKTGKKQYVSKTVRGTKREAERVLARLVAQAEDGAVTARSGTVAELCEAWFEHASPDLSPTTVRGYRAILDRRIIPKWGDTPLRKVRAVDLDRWYGELRARGGPGGTALAANTVMRVHAVLHRALGQGVRWGWLASNPADHATPGRPKRNEIAPPSPDAVVQLIEKAAEVNAGLPVFLRLAAATGARRGELCALRWSNVDFEGRQLVIDRALVEVGGRLVEKDTKTHAARRVGLDEGTLEMLREHRSTREELARACGTRLPPDSYLFSHEVDGSEPWRPGYVTTAFTRIRDELGLGAVRLHDLRHFTATRLLAAGKDVRTVSGRLGHANAATTLSVYAHFLQASDHDAADAIGALLDHEPACPKRSHPLRRVEGMSELVVFDGDDTLWEVEPLYDDAREMAARIVEHAGLDPDAWRQLQLDLDVANFATLGFNPSRFPRSSVQAYEQLAGDAFDPEIAERVRTASAAVFDARAPLVDGALEVLDDLRQDCRLALVTQGDPRVQDRRVSDSGLRDLFEITRIVEHKTEVTFEALLADMHAAPHDAWSVGNSLPSDINSALRVGMSAIWIPSHVWARERRELEPAPGRVFTGESIRAVPGIVRSHSLLSR